MNQASPTWQPTDSMGFPRSFLNLTNLPDGTVLATGGGTDKSSQIDANGVLVPENWDPATGKWTKSPRWRGRGSTTRARCCCPTGGSTSPAAAATTA